MPPASPDVHVQKDVAFLDQKLIEAPGRVRGASAPLVSNRVAVSRAQDGRVLFVLVESRGNEKTSMERCFVHLAVERDVLRLGPLVFFKLENGRLGDALLGFDRRFRCSGCLQTGEQKLRRHVVAREKNRGVTAVG